MESKEERKRMLPSPSETQLKGLVNVSTNACADGSHAEQCSPGDDSESFYMKLAELLESSGLSLIFNVRETLLDLYLFYLEVTRRGGYHQLLYACKFIHPNQSWFYNQERVGREKKWGEVVFALKLEGNSVKLCAQVEKLYAHLLYQFEKLYFYRHPAKQAGSFSTKGPLQKKRNSTASLPHKMNIKDGQKVTEMNKDYSYHMTGAGYVEQPVLLLPPSNVKEMKKRRGSPPGRKTAYQIFLKHECARLKTCSQALDGQKILRLAIDTWRNMSDIEKQPYVEESKKNKEEIKEAMNGPSKQQSTQDTIKEEKWHSLSGDYLVTSQPETDNSLVNKTTAGLVLKMAEEAPSDPSYLMDWDAYCSLVLPTRESSK